MTVGAAVPIVRLSATIYRSCYRSVGQHLKLENYKLQRELQLFCTYETSFKLSASYRHDKRVLDRLTATIYRADLDMLPWRTQAFEIGELYIAARIDERYRSVNFWFSALPDELQVIRLNMISTGQFVVGIIGNITSICLFLSPAPTFVKICRAKCTGEYSAVPYLATLLNCLLWLFYGSPFVKMGVLVVTINGAGACIEILYLSIYLIYAKNGQKLRNTLVMISAAVLFFIVVVLINMLAFHEHHRREVVVGVLCVIVGTSMYVSPLTIMKTVIDTKSTEFMPLPLSVFNLLNGIIWTTYALIGHDLFITIPNALGVFFAICQQPVVTGKSERVVVVVV